MSTVDRDIDIYRKLQEHLDQLPVGFPPTKSGVELRILRGLFAPNEAQIATGLRFSPETAQEILGRNKDLGMTVTELEQTLVKMANKGCINVRNKAGKKLYSNALFVVGMYEYQVKNMSPQFVKDVLQYDLEAFGTELFGTRIPQMRTIPIEKSVTPVHYIQRYDELEKVVEHSDGPFAVTECICRKATGFLDNPCRMTSRKETCIGLGGDMMRMYVDNGWAREITREECLEILRKNQEEGLVLQPGNTERPDFICSCCKCCCGMLMGFNLMPKPVEFVSSNYHAQVDPDLCAGCGTCVKRCQMSAVRLVDNVAHVNLNRCIGCGLCVPTCEAEAMHLVKKDKQIAPPKSWEDLYARIVNRKNEIRQKTV